MKFFDSLHDDLDSGTRLRGHRNYGDNALTLAAWKADVKTVKYIIENNGIKPGWLPVWPSPLWHVDKKGRNAFLKAMVSSNFEMMRYLNDIDPGLKYAEDY